MRRLAHLALVLAVMALLLPAAALACDRPSAVCVYYDGGSSTASGTPTTGGYGSGSLPPRISRLIDRQGGKDKPLLRKLASIGLFGKPLTTGGIPPVNGSSAFDAIFDLGAGPTALFALLLGGAAVFGLRKLRIRRAG